MKKLMIAAVAACVAVSAFAETEKCPFDFHKKPKDEAERQARKAYVEQRIAKHSGGRIVKPGTLKGEIVYVNCQKRADVKWLEFSADYFRGVSKFNIAVKDGAFDFAAPAIQGNASLFVVDDENLPPLLVAPESRWAVVNIAPLAKDAAPAFFEARVKKELTRGFCALCGAMNSNYPEALTGGVAETKQLDKFADHKLPVDVIARFAPYMAPFGVTPAQITTYRSACKQGWAPAPTNDYQKAIWTEIHTPPSDPIKIKYEKAKSEK